jgi:hypothetical protein
MSDSAQRKILDVVHFYNDGRPPQQAMTDNPVLIRTLENGWQAQLDLQRERKINDRLLDKRAGVRTGQPAPRTPKPRIRIKGMMVFLDGRPIPLDMTEEARGAALCLLAHLLAAAGDWRSRTQLDAMERAGPCKLHVKVRWDRCRKKLPPCLLSLTESDRRKGYRLLPAAWHR